MLWRIDRQTTEHDLRTFERPIRDCDRHVRRVERYIFDFLPARRQQQSEMGPRGRRDARRYRELINLLANGHIVNRIEYVGGNAPQLSSYPKQTGHP